MSVIKQFLLTLCIVLGSAVTNAEMTEPNTVFAEANRAYEAGDYAESFALYKQLLPEHPSTALYYNLGNAAYRLEDYGAAILYYEKARVMAPGNPDIQANLNLARDAAELTTPDFNWLERLAWVWPVNRWAWLGAACFWMTLALILLPGLWGINGPLRRAAIVLGAVCFLITALALAGYHQLSSMGVALSDEAALKLSPTTSAPAQDYLKSGEIAHVQRSHGNHYFVETREGNTGWVDGKDFQSIWD